MSEMLKEEKLARYPNTDTLKVVDTIGVPHPYCITPKHIEYSESIYLDIPGAEARGAVCDICKRINRKDSSFKILKYDEHEQALLVEVDSKAELEDVPGLQEYLLSIKDMCEADGYVGFAFVQKKEG